MIRLPESSDELLAHPNLGPCAMENGLLVGDARRPPIQLMSEPPP